MTLRDNGYKCKKECCYILAYYSPDYVRTQTLVQALNNINDLTLHQARNTVASNFRYCQTLLKLLKIRLTYNPDYYILGFRGHELFWLIRLITWRKTLIFDQMMSPYDSLVNERKVLKKGGIVDKIGFYYERGVLLYSDILLVDTYKHKDYFSRLFNIDPEKFYVISVSTNEDLFIEKPTTPRRMDNEAFDVFFYGSFQPLHGVNVILEAAAALKRSPITFTIVGGNRKKFSEFNRLTQSLELDNVTYIKWIEYQQLPEFIQNADLCLGGPFGNTGQSQRVITGKTFQFLAMGRPVVIGETDLNYGFVNKVNCLLVRQGDAEALVDVIWWAYQHRDKLPKIGQKGRELYHKRFSVACIQKSLEVIFES